MESTYNQKNKVKYNILYNKCKFNFGLYIKTYKNHVKLLIENKTQKSIKGKDYLFKSTTINSTSKNKSITSLTPIPYKSNKQSKTDKEKKDEQNLERNAVIMRTIEYSNKIKNHKKKNINNYSTNRKCILQQQKAFKSNINIHSYCTKNQKENNKIHCNNTNTISSVTNRHNLNILIYSNLKRENDKNGFQQDNLFTNKEGIRFNSIQNHENKKIETKVLHEQNQIKDKDVKVANDYDDNNKKKEIVIKKIEIISNKNNKKIVRKKESVSKCNVLGNSKECSHNNENNEVKYNTSDSDEIFNNMFVSKGNGWLGSSLETLHYSIQGLGINGTF